MARFAPDGKTSLWWVSSISNKSAPTASEISAGVNLTGFLAPEGFDTGVSSNLIDSAGIDDVFDAQVVGTWGAKPKATFFRDDTTDTAWNTLVRGSVGFWVVRERTTSSTSIAAGQKVDVYPAQLQQALKGPITKNEMQKFTSEAAITGAPVFAVTVA